MKFSSLYNAKCSLFFMLASILTETVYGCSFYSPRDCQDVQDLGFTVSGVYRIYPGDIYNGFDVWCDMETDGGGWIVFQRRKDGLLHFKRNFKSYHKGFGDVSGEHWLGNYRLNIITSQSFYGLRVDLLDWEGNTNYTVYDHFKVADSSQYYALAIEGWTDEGGAGNSLTSHKGQQFSAYVFSGGESCGNKQESGWWFLNSGDCVDSNLNGVYHNNSDSPMSGLGVIWQSWKGRNYSLKGSEMKIRRI